MAENTEIAVKDHEADNYPIVMKKESQLGDPARTTREVLRSELAKRQNVPQKKQEAAPLD